MTRTVASWILAGFLGAVASAQQPKPQFEVASVKASGPQATTTAAGATVVAQEAKPTFEVASVRKQAEVVRSEPSAAPAPAMTTTYRTRNATVATLIIFAYGVIAAQVVSGPSWVREDFFEIDARTRREASRDEMRLMVRSLLEDRFNLVIHREQRELRTSTIVLARQDGRLGPDLQPCKDRESPPVSKPPTRIPRGSWVDGASCVPIFTVARMASGVLRGPATDGTGLTGLWTFRVVYATEVDGEAPQFETALQEQLGLKLESRRESVEVIVIDSVQQPTEN